MHMLRATVASAEAMTCLDQSCCTVNESGICRIQLELQCPVNTTNAETNWAAQVWLKCGHLETLSSYVLKVLYTRTRTDAMQMNWDTQAIFRVQGMQM